MTKPMKTKWTRHALLCGAVVASIGLAVSARVISPPSHAASEAARPSVEVVQPRRMALAHRVETNATLEAFETADLYAKVAGFVSEVRSDIGEHIKKGQVLAVIDVPELEGELAEARAQLEAKRAEMALQEATLRRQEALFGDQAITEQTLDEARTKTSLAKAQYAVATAVVSKLTAQVGYARITAPFDGIVTARAIDRGDLVQPAGGRAEPLFTVQNVDMIRVYCSVPEADATRVAIDDPVVVKPVGLNKTFAGKVARFARRLDPATRNMRTEVYLPNPDGALFPGMYAQISIEMNRKPDALAVPVTAVANDANGSFVFLVGDGDQTARMPVKTGLNDSGWVEITDGLVADSVVVATARGAPAVGTPVKAVPRAAAK